MDWPAWRRGSRERASSASGRLMTTDLAPIPASRRSLLSTRRFKLLVVLVAFAAGIGYLAVIAARSGTSYYVTPTELLANPTTGVDYRLGGRVVPNTIRWDTEHKVVHFQIA